MGDGPPMESEERLMGNGGGAADVGWPMGSGRCAAEGGRCGQAGGQPMGSGGRPMWRAGLGRWGWLLFSFPFPFSISFSNQLNSI
jgi:hypothetical protein